MSDFIGDCLILFDPQAAPPVGRLGSRGWEVALNVASMRMQKPMEGWRGFPFYSIVTGHWHLFLLGENDRFDSDSLTADNLHQKITRQTGGFLAFVWDSIKNQWHVWTDRFGTLHAYYACDGHRAALGTFSPAVAQAASKKELDWEALAAWFSFGFFPADRTHFKDVRILRPASHYIFDEQGHLLKQERYWNWHYDPHEKRSYDDTVDAFGQVFHEVMGDAFRDGRVAVPVSGGLDSRSTVAGISEEMARGGRLWGYSYGYESNSVETHIARDVAEARRLPFQAYTIQPYLFDEIDRVLSYTEGFQDITQARQMAVRDEIASHADVLIAALWGDVWLDDMGLVSADAVSDETVMKHVMKKIRKPDGWLAEKITKNRLDENVDALLENFIYAELKPLQDISSPDFRVKAYKTEQWSFRWSIPPTRIFQSAAWPRKIFYDTRLADFFATVPASFLSGRRLQIDYLKRFAPDLARITWQAYDANLYQYQYFNTWLLPKRALKKAQRILRGNKIFERNWEVQFLNPQGRAGLEHWLLRPGLRLHDFVSANELRSLLARFRAAPGPVDGYTVSMLLTFSAWLEKYG